MAIDLDQLRSVISRMEATLAELRSMVVNASLEEQENGQVPAPTPDESER